MCRMPPKFHPELNPIGGYWGATKQYLRGHCGFTFPTLVQNLPPAAVSVPIGAVRRRFNRARRFNSLYLFEGNAPLDFRLRGHAMRLFTNRREVPATLPVGADKALARRKGKATTALARGGLY